MNTMRLLFAVKKKQHDKYKGEIERESGGRKIGIDGNRPTDRHTNSKYHIETDRQTYGQRSIHHPTTSEERIREKERAQ